MTIDDVRRRARQELGEVVSMETADYLLERPPGGWDSLATKDDLDRRFAEVDRRFAEVDRRFAEVDRRFDHIAGQLVEVDRRLDDIGGQFTDLHTVFDARLRALASELSGATATLAGELRNQIAYEARTQTWRLVAAMISLGGVIVAAIRL